MVYKHQYKYGVIFAGQGAQKPGMGRELYETSAAARAIFDAAGEAVKYDCFEADEERLRQTEVTQPAVYTMDMAAFAALSEQSTYPPCAFAGFSLGEYAALTAGGAIEDFETGLEIVKKRSLFMRDAGTNPDGGARGAMAAGMGDMDAVLALVEKARGWDILEAANFNSPQQTVVAGDVAAVSRFTELAKSNRDYGVKAIPLSVSGAFHSPLMRPAAEALAEALKDYTFRPLKTPVYANLTGWWLDGYEDKLANVYMSTDADTKIKHIMVRQIQSAVQWQKTVKAMERDSILTLIEVGPGKTLTGLVKKIAPEVRALHVEDAASLAEAVSIFA